MSFYDFFLKMVEQIIAIFILIILINFTPTIIIQSIIHFNPLLHHFVINYCTIRIFITFIHSCKLMRFIEALILFTKLQI